MPKIAQFYRNYGGTGSYFSGNVIKGGTTSGGKPATTGIENSNQKKIQAKLETQSACKPRKAT